MQTLERLAQEAYENNEAEKKKKRDQEAVRQIQIAKNTIVLVLGVNLEALDGIKFVYEPSYHQVNFWLRGHKFWVRLNDSILWGSSRGDGAVYISCLADIGRER